MVSIMLQVIMTLTVVAVGLPLASLMVHATTRRQAIPVRVRSERRSRL